MSVTAGQFVFLAAEAFTNSGTLSATAWNACGNLVTYGSSTALGTVATGLVVSAKAISTGTCVIIVNDTVSNTIEARWWIWSGGSSYDTSGNLAALGSITSGTTFSCPAVTTTINGDLVFCAFFDGQNNGGSWTSTAPFTLTVNSTTISGQANSQSVAGAITPQANYNNTSQVGVATITISSTAIPTIASSNGVSIGNAVGSMAQWNGIYINPATGGYVGKINTLATPFTALPVLTFADFHTGSNTAAPTTTDLATGTYGGLFSYALSTGAGMTYTNTVSAGNLPQPVMAGSNVYSASGTIGLLCTSSASAITATYCGSATQQIATVTPPSASSGYWYKATGSFPNTVDGGAIGILVGGADYINVHINGVSGSCAFNGIMVEGKGGNSTDCVPFTASTLYRINGQENTGEAAFTGTFSNGSASISATQTLAANQAVKIKTTGALPTNFNLILSHGTYTSGITATGNAGTYCTLSSFNGGGSSATAQVYLQSNNSISGGNGLTFTSRGSGYTSAPTSATAGNGTATCSGTAVVSTVLATPILFVSPTGLSGSAFQLAATQNGTPIVAGSAGSGTQAFTVYNVVTICTGNPPTFLGTMFSPSYTTPSTPAGVQMGVSGEGPQATGYTFFFGAYTLNINGTISTTACIL
jgi:hypothetical protein